MIGTQKIARSTVATVLSTAAILSLGVTPALADDDTGATQVTDFIDGVRPNDVVNDQVTPQATGAFTASGNEVSIPTTSDGVLTVASDTGFDINVVLPGAGSAGAVAADGTVVYGEEDGVALAVQSDSGNARVHTVFEDEDDVQDVAYSFPDLTPQLNRDGSVTLVATVMDGGVSASVGHIEAPWAADADGDVLETSDRVEGNTVIQEVVVDEDTAFPVVADPSFQADCGVVTCTLRFNRTWTKRVRDFGGATGAMVGALITAGASLGGPIGAAIGAAAGVIVGTRAAVFSTQAGDFYRNGNCFGIKFPAVSPGLGWGTQVKRGTYNCA